jgi:glutaredoxin
MSIEIGYLSWCPYSRAALETFKKYKIPITDYEADNNPDRYKEKNYVYNNKYTSFPQIYWLNNKEQKLFVGGNSEFQDILKKFRLKQIPKRPAMWESQHEWLNFLTYIAKEIK